MQTSSSNNNKYHGQSPQKICQFAKLRTCIEMCITTSRDCSFYYRFCRLFLVEVVVFIRRSIIRLFRSLFELRVFVQHIQFGFVEMRSISFDCCCCCPCLLLDLLFVQAVFGRFLPQNNTNTSVCASHKRDRDADFARARSTTII